jgi:hypothetical protein
VGTTPLWVTLIVATLGLVSTVVGIVVTQIMANRRERESWQRETDRERERWAREDRARTFEHRRDAYAQFYYGLHTTLWHELDPGPDEIFPIGSQIELLRMLWLLELYASQRVTQLARAAYEAAAQWGRATRRSPSDDALTDDMHTAAFDATGALLNGIRADLHVPDQPA